MVDRGVRIPAGPGGRRGSAAGRSALPSHRARHLPDHAADDRPIAEMTPIGVLSVVSEIFPLIKTGGLADVAGALPGALAAEDVAVRSLIPGLSEGACGAGQRRCRGACGRIVRWLKRASWRQRRPGSICSCWTRRIFLRATATPIAARTAMTGRTTRSVSPRLSRVAALLGQGLVPGHLPDIVHAHDWQTGLAPAYLHYAAGPRPATVMTVHNLAFQGQFPSGLLTQLGLPAHAYATDGVEYYSSIGYLKSGLQFADRITTVSPTYALEIRTPSGGMGMDGLLRTRAHVLSGILNGIDETVWDPAHDPHLAARFDIGRLTERAANKVALQARFGLDVDPSRMVFGAITRLTAQKGTDLLLEALAGADRSRRPAGLARVGRQCARVAAECGCHDASGQRRRASGLRRDTGASHPGRLRCIAGPVTLRTVRPHPALRDALRCSAHRRPCRRSLRHGGRCQRDGASGRRRHGISLCTGRDGYARRGDRTGVVRVARNPSCGAGCSATPCRPTLAGVGRPNVMHRSIAT